MRFVTLDFETYYDKDFSLSKITTENYIRDSRFQVIGFSYKIDDGEPVWVSGEDEAMAMRLAALDIGAFDPEIELLRARLALHDMNQAAEQNGEEL